MNRRGFFTALAGLTATAVLDPERLLWVPGQKLISIPKPMTYNRIEIREPRGIWYLTKEGHVAGYLWTKGMGCSGHSWPLAL
jgi:hypothetical protein